MFRFLDVFQTLSYARLVESRLKTADACQDQCRICLKQLWGMCVKAAGLSAVCLSHPWLQGGTLVANKTLRKPHPSTCQPEKSWIFYTTMMQCGIEILPQLLVRRDKGTGQSQGHQQIERNSCVIPHSNHPNLNFSQLQSSLIQQWTFLLIHIFCQKKKELIPHSSEFMGQDMCGT